MRWPKLQWNTFASAGLHGTLLFTLLGSWHLRPQVVETRRLPGAVSGTQVTLEYRPGGASPAVATALHVSHALPLPRPAVRMDAKASPAPSAASTAAAGAGVSGESSLGDGNISIALVRTHPRPAPDLSSLPHGAAGDVVLEVTIDAEGRIAAATLARGLGAPIDQAVLAMVQAQWTFAPATRNGVAIASEQELLFHYERS